MILRVTKLVAADVSCFSDVLVSPTTLLIQLTSHQVLWWPDQSVNGGDAEKHVHGERASPVPGWANVMEQDLSTRANTS